MALSGTTNKVSFTPTAGTTSLTFIIPFFDATTVSVANKKYGDIKVTRTRSGTDLLLTPVTSSPTADQFQLSATNGDPSQGGVITIAASSSGDKFTIERDVEYTQQYDLQEGATIDPTALNKAFDRVVAQNQQQNDLITRTVEFPVSDDISRTYTVSTETERANKALGFDASGNVTELDLVDSGAVSGNANAGISVSGNIISTKVDDSSTAFDGNGNISVKDSGITAAKLNTDAVTTDKILSDNVTYDKLQDISTSNSVLGNTGTGTVAERALVGDILLNEPTMTSNSAIKGSTQQSIKSYVDLYKPNVVNNFFNTRSIHTLNVDSQTFISIANTETTITPKVAGSKLLVSFSLSFGTAQGGKFHFKISESINGGAYSTVTGLPTGTGVKSHFVTDVDRDDNENITNVSYQVLLEPSYTAGQTVSYRLSAGVANAASPYVLYMNSSETITQNDDSLSTSSIVIQEIYQ
jgi:hypothetical protein